MKYKEFEIEEEVLDAILLAALKSNNSLIIVEGKVRFEFARNIGEQLTFNW